MQQLASIHSHHQLDFRCVGEDETGILGGHTDGEQLRINLIRLIKKTVEAIELFGPGESRLGNNCGRRDLMRDITPALLGKGRDPAANQLM
jgi:hypothetical protein